MRMRHVVVCAHAHVRVLHLKMGVRAKRANVGVQYYPKVNMATYNVLSLVALLLCSWRLPVAGVFTEPSEWGNVRSPRVLSINDTINVHIVPHTHDDVGWLKTVDEYYYGGMFTAWNNEC